MKRSVTELAYASASATDYHAYSPWHPPVCSLTHQLPVLLAETMQAQERDHGQRARDGNDDGQDSASRRDMAAQGPEHAV